MQYAYMHSNELNHKNSLLEGLGGYRALKATESISGPQVGSSSTPRLCMTISITSKTCGLQICEPKTLNTTIAYVNQNRE